MFKSREKLAPIGPMLTYELSSIKKKLASPEMRAITEEDEEAYVPSMIHSEKKRKRQDRRDMVEFEKDFWEGEHKIGALPKLEK